MNCLSKIMLTLFLATASTAPAADSTTDQSKHPLLGSWKMISFKYGGGNEFRDVPSTRVHLKHITPTHFTWLQYNSKSRQISRGGGGTYTLKGNEYIEHAEYGIGGDIEPMLGHPHHFTWKVEGNKWYHRGKLSTGLEIEEIWERVQK